MRQLSSLDQRVLLTVAYCDQFSYPLLAREVWARVISFPEDSEAVSLKTVQASIAKLVKMDLLEEYKKYLFLTGRAAHVKVRQARARWAVQKHHEIAEVLQFARRIPWIQAMFLTGSMAMANIEQESDIDFLIVTSPKRVWLTRLLMSFFAQLKGKRRSWHGEEKNSWCFNLWLDAHSLQVAPAKQGMYRAYEVAQAKVIFDRGGYMADFYQQNAWVKKILPNWWQQHTDSLTQEKVNTEHNVWWLAQLDSIAWRLQQWYMRPHQTIEKTAPQYAFFHPRDTEKMIYRKWIVSLKSILPAAMVKKLQLKLEIYD